MLLLFIIIATPLASAYYPGEKLNIEHNLGTDQLVYTIVDNVTSIVEPIVAFNSTHINITFPTSMPPQSYKIVFLEETTNEVIVEVPVYSSGGGGTRTKYVDKEIIKEVPNYITAYIDQEENQTLLWADGEVLEEDKFLWPRGLYFLLVIILGILTTIIIFKIGKWRSNSKENIELEGGKEYE